MGATKPGRRLRAALLAAAASLIASGCGSSSSSKAVGPGTGSNTASSSPTTAAATPPTTSATAAPATAATAPAQPGPERIPLEPGPALAPASTTTPGAPVDGVKCAPVEQVAYHIHAHLQVYVRGQPRSLPGAIGLLGPVNEATSGPAFYGAQQCYYWLHTHTSDGVIHVESPTRRIYTLGNFFDEWRQPLAPNRVAAATGKVTAFLNGRRWNRNPRQIPLLPHGVIQLDIGSPAVAFAPVSWAGATL